MGVIQDMRLDNTHKGREAFSEVRIAPILCGMHPLGEAWGGARDPTKDEPYSRCTALPWRSKLTVRSGTWRIWDTVNPRFAGHSQDRGEHSSSITKVCTFPITLRPGPTSCP
jgi:hypothetical protein